MQVTAEPPKTAKLSAAPKDAVPGAVGSVLTLNFESAVQIVIPGLKVALRNLVIGALPGGTGSQGVDLTAASTLTIDNCLIANVPYNGVRVSGGGKVEITNTVIRDNGGYGVILFDGSSADISGTKLLKNSAGALYAYAYDGTAMIRATVSDSVISGIDSVGDSGIYAASEAAGGDARVFVTRSTIQGTRYALRSRITTGGSALIGVSYSMVANNAYGWYVSGAGSVIRSLGNNHISDPAFSGSLTLTALQ